MPHVFRVSRVLLPSAAFAAFPAMPGPMSDRAVRFTMRSEKGSRQPDVIAYLTAVATKSFKRKLDGWKAVIAARGERRLFGNFRRSIDEAVGCMLEKHGARISGAERARLEDAVAAMRARINDAGSHGGPTVSHPTGTRDALPVAPIESSLATSQVAPTEAIEHANQVASIEAIGSPRRKRGRPTGVQSVHQMYGLFGDGKDMPPLFSDIAAQME